jgi:hypothetical protein
VGNKVNLFYVPSATALMLDSTEFVISESNVDFPHPEGPKIAVIVLSGKDKFMGVRIVLAFFLLFA